MTATVKYYITKPSGIGSALEGLNKIIDYLLTFVGEVQVKKNGDNKATIVYTDSPITAELTIDSKPKHSDTKISGQITLTCLNTDNVSVNLIRNAVKNIGFRIYNPKTESYLVNDPNLLDLTTHQVDKTISKVLLEHQLFPIFQYNGSLVFFGKDKKGRIHLINRHLVEYFVHNPKVKTLPKEFSKVVAQNIGVFVALCDRGITPISYHKYLDGESKIVNLNGINLDKLYRDLEVSLIYFRYDQTNQSFGQTEIPGLPAKIKVNKGGSAVRSITNELKKNISPNYLAIKVAQDVSYSYSKDGLVPVLSASIFLDS